MSAVFSSYGKKRTVNSLNITWLGVNYAGEYHQLALRSESYLAWLISKDPLLQNKKSNYYLQCTFTMLPCRLRSLSSASWQKSRTYNLRQERIYVQTKEIQSLTSEGHKIEN